MLEKFRQPSYSEWYNASALKTEKMVDETAQQYDSGKQFSAKTTDELLKAAEELRRDLDLYKSNGNYVVRNHMRDQYIMDLLLLAVNNQLNQDRALESLAAKVAQLESTSQNNAGNAGKVTHKAKLNT